MLFLNQAQASLPEKEVQPEQVVKRNKLHTAFYLSFLPRFTVAFAVICSIFHRAMLADLEKTLIHEQTILSRLDALAAQITEDYRDKELTVVAVLNGSLIFAADLLRRIPLPLKLDTLTVSSYHGGTESSGVVTFHQLHLPDINGRHVLIVDDILDTGRTLHAISRKLRQETNPLSVRVCVLLRKQVSRAQELEADYVGFDIANEFVIGYGLDYQERYRNLPFIGVLRRDLWDK